MGPQEDTLEHYGYDATCAAPAVGYWANDGTVFERLAQLPEVLQLNDARKKKIRIVLDYDPDYPRALLQIWGLSQALTTQPEQYEKVEAQRRRSTKTYAEIVAERGEVYKATIAQQAKHDKDHPHERAEEGDAKCQEQDR